MDGSELTVWGVWEWVQGEIRCSQDLAKQLGLENEFCPLAQWWERVPPLEQAQVQQVWQAWLAGERLDLQVGHGWVLPSGGWRRLWVYGQGWQGQKLGWVLDVTALLAPGGMERDELQTVLDAFPGTVSWIGQDLRYLGVNHQLAHSLNLPVTAFPGQEVGFLSPNPVFNEFVRGVFADPDRYLQRELELQVPVGDGNHKTFLVMAQKYQQGSAAVFVGVDITERRRVEAQLRHSEDRFRRLIEELQVGLQLWGAQGEHVLSNRAALEILGMERGRLDQIGLYDRGWNVIDEQGQPLSSADLPVARVLADGQSVRNLVLGVYRQRYQDRVWLLVTAEPQVDEQGQVVQVICTFSDITERRRVEQALRESRERYALAVAGANDGLWDWDLSANEMYFSNRWQEMLGYREGEISPNPDEWIDRIHPEDRDRVRNELSAHLTGLTPHFESEHRVVHRDGRYHWMLCRGLAVRDTDGQVYRMAGSQTDITRRKQTESQLRYDATHDSLTDLANRALFLECLEKALRCHYFSRQDGVNFAVLFLDLDRFKIVNDSLGHMSGDRLLVAIAQQLRRCLRSGDVLARFGGDEFAILLNGVTSALDATLIAEQIHGAFKEPFPLGADGLEVFTSASVGLVLGPGHYLRPEEVLRDVDAAMHEAKLRGKACTVVFDHAMYTQALRLLQVETDLRRAIEREELCVFYQPIVSLLTGALTGFEALVRWRHPQWGLVSPGEFIPLAEETGLILSLGRWVLHQACDQMRRWQRTLPGTDQLSISVNLSGRQLLQPHLLEQVGEILTDTSLDPQFLRLEITESVLGDYDEAVTILKKLKDLGVDSCIDDFGTGHSSLSRLHRFPIDRLKIDQSFVSQVEHDRESGEIIRTIMSLAQSLHMDVTAEGVETRAQRQLLQSLDCQYAQGFLFSRPLPSAEMEALIQHLPHW
ncbi:diguanylate cyclase/phosphodiesterase with PAS/PAC sensor(s) [Gloeomargarita lithophora Alchichica-D10]|uniref:Diguanylate cyclase/phosphodiesterase with PAS/PAC sensor(S) n=1 Tax=Gloeomargarita lithophora Alchichica-D10 TaxID=1188229 RepID=A0A1J0AGR0_9CYAN|nr:EAL domain-containing protein [Gloeomargarita lithophora]APB35103.1 diguanylate cyclase/phosphodiesterase with PAS/PAC sensor(s) [Gloeomargarita lithophora Alchichica-D10]